MNKYEPLGKYLAGLPSAKVGDMLTFAQVEKIIGGKLPASAYAYREWWANQQGGSRAPHWRAAGFSVERVDLSRKLVEFRRVGATAPVRTSAKPPKKPSAEECLEAIDQDILLSAGFRAIAPWELAADGRIRLVGDIPSEPATYAHVVDGKVYYIGSATMGLKKRVYFYGRPGKTQRTSTRINGLVKALLEQGKRVELIAAFPGMTEWKGLPVDLVTGLETGLIKKHCPPWNKRGVAG